MDRCPDSPALNAAANTCIIATARAIQAQQFPRPDMHLLNRDRHCSWALDSNHYLIPSLTAGPENGLKQRAKALLSLVCLASGVCGYDRDGLDKSRPIQRFGD
jgi:hypothetical protein